MKHIPRKRFGQNFLTDQLVISSIINVIAPQEDDHMVEIGPGQGAMTALLIQALNGLHVVEIDRDLVVLLEKKFKSANLIMHAADALQFDFGSLINAAQPDRKLRVVGNLPYNISTPLLFHLADFSAQIIDQHFMLQKEVVERMVAEPGGKEYGRLSVMLQWRYTMDCLFIVPPTAFDPPPKVESAIVRMLPIVKPLECEQQKLELVVMKAFSQRRKVLRNCLSSLFTENQLIDLGIDPTVRPETVSVEQFVRLARELAEHA
jgi:16S rRNA (adenine1518-N6/adenine1519-N6)-dimethyltransferase